MNRKFWNAVFALVGTTIGAGIFGLPYVFAKAGFFLGLIELIVVGVIVLIVQWMVGEVALRTKGRKRLLGFAEKYLGRRWYYLLLFAIIFASIGTLLSYFILAGQFIASIFNLNIFWGTVLFFAVWFPAILFRAKTFGRFEFYISVLSIGLIIFIAFGSLGYIKLDNLKTINFRDFLIPYGVILFAITGTSVIPEMEDILANSKNKLKKAITLGTLIPVVVYIIFTAVIVGASGSLISQDAISGFALALNSKFILVFGALLGLAAVSGAALSYGVYFKETLWYDLKFNKWLSWLFAGGTPFLLFLFNIRNFVRIIGLVGAIILGFQLITILMIHRSAKSSELQPIYEIKISEALYWFLGVIFILGAALELWYSRIY